MWVIYAYCNHCGNEYAELIYLACIRITVAGTRLKCEDCGGEIYEFIKE